MTDGFRVEYTVEIFPDRFEKQVERLSSPTVERSAKRLRDAARGFIGTEYSGTTGKPKEARSGPLADSGKVVKGSGAGWLVIFDHPIANIHHNGAKGHSIGGKGQKLGNKNFPNTRPDHPLYPDRLFAARGPVWHPGHDGNPFLIKGANAVGLRGAGALRRGPTDTNPIFRSVTLG